MLGCNTVCPKCRHEFTCCPPMAPLSPSQCCAPNRRSLHGLSGGGLVNNPTQIITTNTVTMPRFSFNNDHKMNPTLNINSNQAVNFLAPQGGGQYPSPQVSPSAPLAFILPFPVNQPIVPMESKPEMELKRLQESVRMLRESGWYHEGLSWQQSQAVLKGTEPGTFLIRDSSDSRFLYALSVQTENGPTSVRLHYTGGKFRLDSEQHIAHRMPLFDTVIDLITYYVKCSARNARTPNLTSTNCVQSGGQVWVDPNGAIFARIFLKKPLLRADRVSSLQHLARLAVHKALEDSARPKLPLLPPPYTELELPTRLVEYLAEYPYSL